MDMCLAEVIGQKASASTRPRMDVLAAWLARRAHVGDRVEACVFANVAPGQEAQLARWVANLRQWGWSVFVKPKQHRRDDIDDEMVRHIERHFRQGTLVELVVASHDGRAFASALSRYAKAGVQVTLLGFRERMNLGGGHEGIEFLDLEHVSGVFAEPLARTNLFDLPRGGRWFEAFAEIEGVRVDPIAEDDLADVVPTPDLDRADVVAFVRQALRTTRHGGLSLQEAGELLRARFPGFTLEGSGYLSVSDLLDELQASGDVAVSKSDNGHLLQALATTDATAETAADATPPPPTPLVHAAPGDAEPSPPDPDPDRTAADHDVIDLTDRGASRPAAAPPPLEPVAHPAPSAPPSDATVEPTVEPTGNAHDDARDNATDLRPDQAGSEAPIAPSAEAAVEVGHAVLELATFGDTDTDTDTDSQTDAPVEQLIDLADGSAGAEQRPAAAGREWPTADQVARANPIYRMFGFDPNGAA